MPARFEQATFVFVSSREGETLGRAERRILAVIPALLDRRATVFVMCPPRTALSAAAAALGATVVDTVLTPQHYLRSTARVRSHLQRHRPVCVHSAGLAADLASRRAAMRLPVNVVNSIPCGSWPRGGRIAGRLDRATLSRADRILVDCASLAPEIVAAGASPERIVYDPPSVSVPGVLTDAGRGTAPPPSGRPAVGFAGRLEHSRGIGVLLDAAELLLDGGAEIDVRIAGVGPALAEVERRIARMADVRVLGEVESIPAVLRTLDVCVFPSIGGGAPTALLEAAVLGRAIVASAVPGIAGLFEDGSEIALVPPGDASALAEAIVRLVRDPAAAAEMGRRARLHALDEYSSTAAVERSLALYRGFLAR